MLIIKQANGIDISHAIRAAALSALKNNNRDTVELVCQYLPRGMV